LPSKPNTGDIHKGKKRDRVEDEKTTNNENICIVTTTLPEILFVGASL